MIILFPLNNTFDVKGNHEQKEQYNKRRGRERREGKGKNFKTSVENISAMKA